MVLISTLIEKSKELVYIFSHGLNGMIYAIITVLLVTAWWMVFVKMGVDGWKIFIPFYRLYIVVRSLTGNGKKFLLLLIPLVNIYFFIIYSFKLAQVFGKSKKFGWGLLLLPWLFIIFLGFGDSEYNYPGEENK